MLSYARFCNRAKTPEKEKAEAEGSKGLPELPRAEAEQVNYPSGKRAMETTRSTARRKTASGRKHRKASGFAAVPANSGIVRTAALKYNGKSTKEEAEP